MIAMSIFTEKGAIYLWSYYLGWAGMVFAGVSGLTGIIMGSQSSTKVVKREGNNTNRDNNCEINLL